MFLFLLLVLTGCDGSASQYTVAADALFSRNTLSLPIACKASVGTYHNYGGTYYSGRLNYVKQRAIVQETCGEENVTEYADYDTGTRLHIRLVDTLGKADDYLLLIAPGGDGGTPKYIFSGMGAEIDYGMEEPRAKLLLPYHLISDTRITRSVQATLYAGAEYETAPRSEEHEDLSQYNAKKRLNEFYEFYLSSGWYESELLENRLIINKDGLSFTITFSSHAGRVFFSIT